MWRPLSAQRHLDTAVAGWTASSRPCWAPSQYPLMFFLHLIENWIMHIISWHQLEIMHLNIIVSLVISPWWTPGSCHVTERRLVLLLLDIGWLLVSSERWTCFRSCIGNYFQLHSSGHFQILALVDLSAAGPSVKVPVTGQRLDQPGRPRAQDVQQVLVRQRQRAPWECSFGNQ